MNVVDCASLTGTLRETFDVVIVGSGPAGATVARALARSGAKVAVLEEGPFVEPPQFRADAFGAMAGLYRDLGSSLTSSRAPMPYLQGRVVGGTSVINGAICWRLPRDVHDGWVKRDPALADGLPWGEIESSLDGIEHDLNIHPTPPEVAGRKNLLLAKGAATLGLEHRPISRNVRGCKGLGRCMQGCPEGNKLSMDRSFLPDACASGAVIYASCEARTLDLSKGRCTGVIARTKGGATVTFLARRAVVVAASAIQSPLLLVRSGLRDAHVGRHFMAHPGVSVTGHFADPVRMWDGATQGHEVTGLRGEGLKFEALGYDVSLIAMRRKGVGAALGRELAELEHWTDWGAAVRATAEGTVTASLGGGVRVRYTLNGVDLQRVRRGVRVLGELFLGAGADLVLPGVHGWQAEVRDAAAMARFEAEGSLDGRDYQLAVTHMFGTCRMSGAASDGVVRPDFRHHAVEGLYVADSSVFPSNTGVNPQTSIMALASICARRIVESAKA